MTYYDYRLENLEWVNGSENVNHCIAAGNFQMGERHTSAKLTDAQVGEIRQLSASMTDQELADKFCVSRRHVTDLRNNKKRKSNDAPQ